MNHDGNLLDDKSVAELSDVVKAHRAKPGVQGVGKKENRVGATIQIYARITEATGAGEHSGVQVYRTTSAWADTVDDGFDTITLIEVNGGAAAIGDVVEIFVTGDDTTGNAIYLFYAAPKSHAIIEIVEQQETGGGDPIDNRYIVNVLGDGPEQPATINGQIGAVTDPVFINPGVAENILTAGDQFSATQHPDAGSATGTIWWMADVPRFI